jgi:hypothetical protein
MLETASSRLFGKRQLSVTPATWLSLVSIAIASLSQPVASAQETPQADMAEAARAYLVRALDAMEQHSLRRSEVDWIGLRRRAFEKANGAQTPRDTYETIHWAVEVLADGHSFFMVPAGETTEPGKDSKAGDSHGQPVPPDDASKSSASSDKTGMASARTTRTRTIAGAGWVIASTSEDMRGELISQTSDGKECCVGYLLVPSFGGEASFDPEKASAFALQLHEHVRRLDELGASSWIVDLRFNSGGNMWPMLAGIGPLLNGNRVGAFVRNGEEPVFWEYAEGRAGTSGSVNAVVEHPHTLKHAQARIVVLVGRYCTSSGEAIAVAFRGREHTRFLGKPTGGATTSTQTVWMGDGAMLFVTNAIYADRTGKAYGGTLTPDEVIPDSPDELADPRPPLIEDPGISAALTWLLEE